MVTPAKEGSGPGTLAIDRVRSSVGAGILVRIGYFGRPAKNELVALGAQLLMIATRDTSVAVIESPLQPIPDPAVSRNGCPGAFGLIPRRRRPPATLPRTPRFAPPRTGSFHRRCHKSHETEEIRELSATVPIMVSPIRCIFEFHAGEFGSMWSRRWSAFENASPDRGKFIETNDKPVRAGAGRGEATRTCTKNMLLDRISISFS